jgi:hypothetical protein
MNEWTSFIKFTYYLTLIFISFSLMVAGYPAIGSAAIAIIVWYVASRYHRKY